MSTLQEYAKLIIKQSEHFLDVCKEISNFSENNLDLFPDYFLDAINLSMLCNTCNLELGINLKNATNSESEYEERYLIKQLHLIVYEISNTLHKNGKAINNLRSDKGFTKLHKKYKKDFANFKNDYSFDLELSKFRNEAIAHFDKDLKSYHKLIDDMCIDTSLEMATSFMNVLSTLQNALNLYIKNITPEETSNTKRLIDLEKFTSKERLQIIKEMNKSKI